MNTALLLITHDELGRQLLATAESILGKAGIEYACLAVNGDSDPDELFRAASGLCTTLDKGDGVLVLTDLYGSTPSNIANRLTETHNVIVVSGVSLPMLLRVMNYPDEGLEQLAEKAASGARDGIVATRRKQAS